MLYSKGATRLLALKEYCWVLLKMQWWISAEKVWIVICVPDLTEYAVYVEHAIYWNSFLLAQIEEHGFDSQGKQVALDKSVC